jgi:hypothetical protein
MRYSHSHLDKHVAKSDRNAAFGVEIKVTRMFRLFAPHPPVTRIAQSLAGKAPGSDAGSRSGAMPERSPGDLVDFLQKDLHP